MQNKTLLYINGEQADTSEGFSLRMNRVMRDVRRIDSGSAEWSFSFSLPSSPTNNRLFGFANSLPVSGKFMRRYRAEVMSGEVTVFSGTLILTAYDAKSSEYTANLVSLKVNTVEDIFGDMTLSELKWGVEYDGAPTIDAENADTGSEVWYPLVAYGVFEKDPVYSDEVANDYTDRLILDSTVRFYHETFLPSLNLVSLVRRLFEQKGYTLTGDIFDDAVMRRMYTSVSLASQQPLDYNYGNPKIGACDLSVSWSNKQGRTLRGRLVQPLSYPYCVVYPPAHAGGDGMVHCQWEDIDRYNMFEGDVTENEDSYLFDPGERCVVVPADGCYRIELDVTATLDTSYNGGYLNVLRKQWTTASTPSIEEVDWRVAQDFSEICPVEIQLTRNTLNDEGDIELIKGKNNRDWRETPTTPIDHETCYPHEQLWQSRNPTDVEPPYNAGRWGGSERDGHVSKYGYFPSAGSVFAYDPFVSDKFICGFSSYLGATCAVMKDGRSWYPGHRGVQHSMYPSAGYVFRSGNTSSTVDEPTGHDLNTYPGAPQCSVSVNGNTLTGKVVCAVWLNRNDILTLNCVHRHWDEQDTLTGDRARYVTNVTARLRMDSFTPKAYEQVRAENLGYSSPTGFDTELQLGNFLSSERKAADFINDFIRAFNLQYRQTGSTVDISRTQVASKAAGVVDIDGRCAWTSAEWSRAEWPRETGVKYSVDENSWGYWTTVPKDRQDERDWKRYGDPMYSLVTVDPDSTTTNVVTIQTSPTYYGTFTLDREGQNLPLTMPVIGDYEVLAPGADYDEAMQKDSLDKRLRLWFRPEDGTAKATVSLASGDETVDIYLPEGGCMGTEMSYKADGGTLLDRYFSTDMDITKDVVSVEVRLTAEEFARIGDGWRVKFDGDLYECLSVDGFDPSGANAATLRLMKA